MSWVLLAANPAGQGSPLLGMLPFIMIMPIFYFLLIRPQQKKQKLFQALLSKLKKDDRIVTSGGIHGLIVAVKEQTLTLKIADNVKIELDKSSVGRVVGTNEEGGS